MQYRVERKVAFTRRLNIWDAIKYGRRSFLIFIERNILLRYIHVMQPVTLPYLHGLVYHIVQQDSVSSHTVTLNTRFTRETDVTIIPWPARSLDHSPFE